MSTPVEIETLSNQLADVVEAVAPSLFRVRGRRFSATGVAWSPDGLIVTAAHAVGRHGLVHVGKQGSDEDFEAELVGRDPSTDLALLRVSDLELTPPAWSDGADLRVGHLVLTVGRPGLGPRAALGLVSGLGGEWRTRLGGRVERYLEVDGRLPSGFSGGLLVDAAGQALGVNSHALARGGGTLPASTVRRVVESLLTRGSSKRGYLGVTVQPTRLPAAAAALAGRDRALLVTGLDDDGPGVNGGIGLGDALLSVAGDAVTSVEELLAALAGRGGEAVAVTLVRAGAVTEVTVTLGEREEHDESDRRSWRWSCGR